MRRRTFVVLLGLFVGLLGGATWWFLLRPVAEPVAALPVCEPDSGVDVDRFADTTPAGSWEVRTGEDVFAGYRVMEAFGGDTFKREITGRSPGVTGSLTVDDGEISSVEVQVDTTLLSTDAGRRDNYLRDHALETERFPRASFVLTDPIVLDGPARLCEAVTAAATGDLELHGVVRSVEVHLDAAWNGDGIDVAGSTPIHFADYGIDEPDIAGLADVDPDGVLEFQLRFVRAG